YVNLASSDLLPSYLLTFGKKERDMFKKGEAIFINPDRIFPVGYYLLNLYRGDKIMLSEKMIELDSNFNVKIIVSGQDLIELAIFDWLEIMALNNPNILFVYVPRNKLKKYSKFENIRNIEIFNESSIYNLINW